MSGSAEGSDVYKRRVWGGGWWGGWGVGKGRVAGGDGGLKAAGK